MLDTVIAYLNKLSIENWIGIAGFLLAAYTLWKTSYDRRIKLGASRSNDQYSTTITIYNNSTRKIVVDYFELYYAKCRYSRRKQKLITWYDDNDMRKYGIDPYTHKDIDFDEMYEIPWPKQVSAKLFITVFVAGKKTKTIKI